MTLNSNFKLLVQNIRNCNLCTQHLPLGPNPIVQISPHAKILIVGQAPGTKVHHSSIPWNDQSGDRLRMWLNLSKPQFYDENRIAIVPMGFCYPGKDKNGGDKPPRKECAPVWHQKILSVLPNIELTLLIGSYAQKYYLKDKVKPSLNETVQSFLDYLPQYFVLPHPSWRNTGWLKKNVWFEQKLLPMLREKVHVLMETEI